MTKESTMDRLHQMRMSVMARAYREQEETPGVEEMTFDERFAMLVDAEWGSRRSNKRVRLLRAAGLAEPGANVMDVRYDADRKLDKVYSSTMKPAFRYAGFRHFARKRRPAL